MKPITVYRRATYAGLLIDLNANKDGLLVFGPRSVKGRHMGLLRKHCIDLVALLVAADNQAAVVIAKAKRRSPMRPAPRRTTETRRKATR